MSTFSDRKWRGAIPRLETHESASWRSWGREGPPVLFVEFIMILFLTVQLESLITVDDQGCLSSGIGDAL